MIQEKALIPLWDLDILQYRCGFAADAQIKKEAQQAEPGASDETIAEMCAGLDYTNIAIHNVKTVIEAVNERFSGEDAMYFVNGNNNFRYDVATIKPYKGNRDTTHKPKYYKEIKDYMVDHLGAKECHGMETDDMLGIVQCSSPLDTVIVTTDKDLQMIPGYNFNWVKGELKFIDPEEADTMFWYQMLTGDATDNIPGITGIGDKRALKLIMSLDGDLAQIKAAVEQKYRDQYGDVWQAAMNEVATLLWIRREDKEGVPLL